MYCGVDLGGTNILIGIIDEKGKTVCKKSIPTIAERGFEEVVKDIALTIKKLMSQNNIDSIESVGVGCPGTVDMQKGIIKYACNLDFKNVDIVSELKKYIDAEIYIANDASCAAIGEYICGNAKGYENSITMTVGTGIGGGIIINGKLFSGAFGGAEIGHSVIKVDGEQCNCGRKGCWEAYASATALIREARVVIAKYPNSKMFSLVNGDIKLMNAKIPFDAAEMGDVYAIEIINNYYKALAEGIANLINIFGPEIILIGGGVGNQGDKIIKPVTELVAKRVYGGVLKTKIASAKFGNDAGMIGAAMLKKFLDGNR